MLKKITFLMLIFLFLLIPNIKATNYYVVDLYNSSTSLSPMDIIIPPAYAESGNFIAALNPYVNISASSGIITTYFSPYGTILATSTINVTGDIECLNLGIANTTTQGDNGTMEVNFQGLFSGTVTELFGSYKFIVSTDQDYITISNRIEDTQRYVPFTYYHHECDTSPFNIPQYDLFDSDTYGICKPLRTVTPMLKSKGFNCIASNSLIQYYFPFNSSSGFVEYDLYGNVTNCQTPTRWRLYPLSNSSSITTLCNADSCSGNITLVEDTIYVLTSWYDFCGAGGLTFYPPEINLTINIYRADFQCGAWSECLNGQQFRTCIDPEGKVPDKIEHRTCAIIELENLTLGFEDFYVEDDVHFCIPSWGITGCSYSLIQNKDVDRPSNWTVVENVNQKQYFLAMTNDWFSEGSRSLRMWYIPPAEDGEPKLSPLSCASLDQGKIPQIYQGVNDSFFIARNITFPASNMLLSFDYLRCSENVLKHSEYRTIFDLLLICPEVCYGGCNQTPNGRFFFNILDTTTSKSILPTGFGWFDMAQPFPLTKQFDLSNLGIVVNRTYNIVFAIFPESLSDQTGHCAMFDNVRYSVLRDPVTCVSECIGVDYRKAQIVNNSCVFELKENSPECLTADQVQLQNNCEFYCEGTTAYIPTDLCVPEEFFEFETVEDHPQCVEEEEARKLTETDETLEALIGVSLSELPVWTQLFFFSPVMIMMFIIAFIAGWAAMKAEHWEVGVIVAIILFIGAAMVLPTTFLWVTVVFIIVAGLAFAGFMSTRTGRR